MPYFGGLFCHLQTFCSVNFRMYTDFALFTLPVRGPKISDDFLSKLNIDGANDRMDCDEDGEDLDYLVSWSGQAFLNRLI